MVVDRRLVVRALWIVLALLLVVDSGFQVIRHWTGHNDLYGLASRFDLDLEQTVPAFYSACQHLGAAILLYVIGRADSQPTRLSAYWLALACLFLFLAFDEAIGMHELLERPTRELLDWLRLPRPPFAWIIPAAIGLAGATPLVLGFLRTIEAKTATRFLVAGAVFVLGAIGAEFPEGYLFFSQHDGLAHRALITMEEGLEMAGMTLFLDALLRHLSTRAERLEIRVTP